MYEELGKELLNELDAMSLRKEKVIMSVWKQISEVLIPELADMDGTSTIDALLAPGYYDGSGRAYLETTANAIFSMMMGPGTNWIQFCVEDEEIMKDREVRRYFDLLRKVVLKRMAQDGFYKIAKPAIKHCLALGTTCNTVTREPEETRLSYRLWHPGDYYHSIDKSGRTDGIGIKQIVKIKNLQKYDWLPQEYIDSFNDKKGDEEVILWFYFRKNREGDPNSELEATFPYTVYHILETGHIIHASGMKGMPGPMWLFEETPRLEYGLCPGYYILRDLLQSNKIRKLVMKETDKESDPALWVSRNTDTFYTEPGSINYHDGDSTNQPRRVFDTADMSLAQQAKLEIDQIVRTHLLVDFFASLTGSTTRRTAQEVQTIQAEMGAQAGPIVYSVEDGFLRPNVKRTLMQLHEMGKLPEPPNKLTAATKDFPLEVLFMGPLSIANRYLYETTQAHRVLNDTLIPLSQIDPEGVQDALNTAGFIRSTMDGIGGGFDVVNTEAEIEQKQREREAKAAQEQQLAAASALMKDGSQAPDPGSPLEAEMQNA